MGYTIERDEPTPNPAARRLVVAPAPGRLVSARAGDPEPDDPLARALLNIEGVAGVLVHAEFVTVSLDPGARWRSVRPGVVTALAGVEPGDG